MRFKIKQSSVDESLSDWERQGWNEGLDARDLAERLESSCAIFLGWDWSDLLPFVKNWLARRDNAQLPASLSE